MPIIMYVTYYSYHSSVYLDRSDETVYANEAIYAFSKIGAILSTNQIATPYSLNYI